MCIPSGMMRRPNELVKYLMTSHIIGSYINTTINSPQCGCLSRNRGLCKTPTGYRHKTALVCAHLDGYLCIYDPNHNLVRHFGATFDAC